MQLDSLIDRLADFAPTTAPVISLYLDGRPDQHGREQYGLFVRKELATHSRTWPPRSPERESFHRDVDRILTWLHEEARPSATGLAIFACAAASDFFETVQLDVPIEEHALFVGATPRLSPLVRLADEVGDAVRLEMTAGEPEVMDRTLAAMRAATTRGDAEAVAAALDAQRAGGLGAVGVDEVRAALGNGQVHELLISDDVDADVAEELVARARRTSAAVRFVDDHARLRPAGV